MTTTPGEPISDPTVQPDEAPNPIAPGEEPGAPSEPAEFPARDPEAEPGQMGEEADPEIGA